MGAIDAGRLSKADKDGRASSESEYSGNTNQCEGQGSFAFGALGLTGHISCKEAAEGGYGQSPAVCYRDFGCLSILS